MQRLFAQLPAILVTGPRATGKTITADRHANTIVRLDRPAEAVAFEADPDAALRARPEPVLLDEWQAAPACSERSTAPSMPIPAPAGSY